MGVPNDSLFMAVLIQQVVPADYAFVIHTVNPSSGNQNELFAEVVLGLGETLVGNYPGRALSFIWDRSAQKATILSYPGKSIGLYGAGLIFRSDSNGEDLEGYAGAGLYDSVLLDEPREAALDYTQEPLVWDQTFRDELTAKIAQIGLEVERACGSPQDVEGAVAQGKFYVVQTRPQVGLTESTQVREASKCT
jgi:alpha-glucan,water dikinase